MKKQLPLACLAILGLAAIEIVVPRLQPEVATHADVAVVGAVAQQPSIVKEPAATQDGGAYAGTPATALLRQAPPEAASRHTQIELGPKDDALSKRSEKLIESRLGAAASIRFRNIAVLCSAGRCEVRGNADGDEVAARLAMRDNSFLDAVSSSGCVTEPDMVVPAAGGSEFVMFLDCRD